jgi:hypothetical protein
LKTLKQEQDAHTQATAVGEANGLEVEKVGLVVIVI